MPRDILLQLILDEQAATSTFNNFNSFKQLSKLVNSMHYLELKDTKVKDKVLNIKKRIKSLYRPLHSPTK